MGGVEGSQDRPGSEAHRISAAPRRRPASAACRRERWHRSASAPARANKSPCRVVSPDELASLGILSQIRSENQPISDNEYKNCVVRDGVRSEPVSVGEFPVPPEFTGNITNFDWAGKPLQPQEVRFPALARSNSLPRGTGNCRWQSGSFGARTGKPLREAGRGECFPRAKSRIMEGLPSVTDMFTFRRRNDFWTGAA
jgi:hypothetical protein